MLTRYTVHHPDGTRESFTREVGSYLYAGSTETGAGWRVVVVGFTETSVRRAALALGLPVAVTSAIFAEQGDMRHG